MNPLDALAEICVEQPAHQNVVESLRELLRRAEQVEVFEYRAGKPLPCLLQQLRVDVAASILTAITGEIEELQQFTVAASDIKQGLARIIEIDVLDHFGEPEILPLRVAPFDGQVRLVGRGSREVEQCVRSSHHFFPINLVAHPGQSLAI